MTATKIQPGDDLHLTSLMAPHSLNFVTGADRAALLAYGRDVFAAGLAGAAPAAVAPQGDKDDSLLLCASDLQHSAIYDSHSEMQDCARSVADRIKALAAPALEAPPAVAPQGEYPYLPQSVGDVTDFGDGKVDIDWGHPAPVCGASLYSAEQMRAYVDADRAARAAQPTAVAGPAIKVPEDWMEHLGFELDAPADGVWMVIDDTGARREANLTERILWKELIAIRAAIQDAALAPAAPALEAPAAEAIAQAITNNFRDAGWSMPSIDSARVLEAVQSALGSAAAPQAPAAPVLVGDGQADAYLADPGRLETLARSHPAGLVRALARAAMAAPAAPSEGEVLVEVIGLTGSGKSAICGEIEILCRALGLDVSWPDGDPEKNMTHAEWTAAIEAYKPRVRIVERNVPRQSNGGPTK